MLLKVTHLGRDKENDRRLYHVQTPRGLGAVVSMSGLDRKINLWLVGTGYNRTYPCPYPIEGIPRIADLEGGYQTLQTFLHTWEHSTPEQREILQEYHDRGIKWIRHNKKTGKEERTKRKLRLVEDRPRLVPAKQDGQEWRVLTENLRAALKGTLQADNIRIGGITVKRSFLWSIIGTKGALHDGVLGLRYEDGALCIRSTDGRAKVRVKHGAGDPQKGRYGWTRRIQLVAA